MAYDNLGAGNVWFPGGQRSTTMPGQGNADHDIAQGFDIAGGDDMRLTSFEVVLYSSFGSRRVEASIVADRDQTTPFHGTLGTEPDMSKVLETWMIAGIPTDGVGTLLQILSADRPVLASGERYWLVLSVPDADSNVAWKSARLDYSGYAMIGERDSGLATFDWTTFLFSDSGGTALRVTGTSDV